MRHIRSLEILCVVVASCILSCCTKPDDDKNTGKTPSVTFPVNPVMVKAAGGETQAAVNCDTDWSAESQVEWITNVSVSTGKDAVVFYVAPNQDTAPRDGKIRISAGNSYTKDLTVRQAADISSLAASPSALELSGEGDEQEVIITGDDWRIMSISADWLKVEKKNSNAITVSAPINYSGVDLDADIVISDAAGSSISISVRQKYDADLFKGATTVAGREFVYKSAGLVTSVTSDKSYDLDENVSVLEIRYKGQVSGSSRSTALFAYEIDLAGGISLKTTCAYDDDSSIKNSSSEETKVQIMREQLADLQGNHPEMTVLGGVNGDFFFQEENNLLHGVFYRNGVCLKESFDGGKLCTVFAIMKDGTAKILTQDTYIGNKANILEGIGGRQQILSNGSTVSNDDTLEPRTAVGVSADGRKVWLIVIDGRNQLWSNGASYPIMAKMFLALGAYNAINLDGGGSSTFVVSETGIFKTINKVTDATGERPVVNGIAIVKE